MAKGKRQVGRRKYLHVWSLDQCTQHKHWLGHLPLLPGNYRLAAKCLSWAGVGPSSEQMLGQRKVISMRKWLQALWFGQCHFSSHTVDQLTPQGLCCPSSLWHHFKLPWGKSWSCWSWGSFFWFWSSAEHSNSASPCQSCAPLPTTPGISAFLPPCSGRLVFKGYSLPLPACPPGFRHFEELCEVSVVQVTATVLQMVFLKGIQTLLQGCTREPCTHGANNSQEIIALVFSKIPLFDENPDQCRALPRKLFPSPERT